MANCPECGALVQAEGVILGEILPCPECGMELEVLCLEPLALGPAPEMEEDWGE
jgi:alpha-aminoadipate carrier protein LysW